MHLLPGSSVSGSSVSVAAAAGPQGVHSEVTAIHLGASRALFRSQRLPHFSNDLGYTEPFIQLLKLKRMLIKFLEKNLRAFEIKFSLKLTDYYGHNLLLCDIVFILST